MGPLRHIELGPRLVAAALAVIAFAAVLPTPAHAAPATRETFRILWVGCQGTTAQGGLAAMQVSTFESILEVDARLFAPGGAADDPPIMSSNPDVSTGTAFLEGDVLAGSVPVFEVATGKPLGDATFVLALTPGESETLDARTRNGNQLTRESVEFTSASASGLLTFPGGPTVAVDCEGISGTNTVFRNNPRAEISVSDVSQAFCDLQAPDGRRLLMTVDAGALTLVELAPGTDPEVDPPLLFGVAEDTLFTRTSLVATVPLFAPSGDDIVFVGDAVVRANVNPGPPTTRFERAHRSYLKIRTWPLTFTGTITMPDARQYDMAACTGHREVIRRHTVTP
jgi:hypothetical protein